jgi:hypothetical protein
MYDAQKVSMSKLRRAYALNDQEAGTVMAALWPHALFPWELWQKAYEIYWRGFADRNATLYRVDSPAFPESNVHEEKYFYAHIYAHNILTLLKKLAATVHANALREGVKYIFEITYEDSSDIKCHEEIDLLFDKLSEIEKNAKYDFYAIIDADDFEAIMDEKIFSIPPTGYNFISQMFSDTILVDTVSAIRQLHFLNIPFRMEVKGITRSLVESVIKSLTDETSSANPSIVPPSQQSLAESAASAAPEKFSAPEAPSVITSMSQPQVQAVTSLTPANIPASLWAGKPHEVAFKNLQGKYADAAIAYILMEKMGCDKTKAGSFFYPDDGEYKENRTYQRKIDNLLKEANQRYSFTFNEQ